MAALHRRRVRIGDVRLQRLALAIGALRIAAEPVAEFLAVLRQCLDLLTLAGNQRILVVAAVLASVRIHHVAHRRFHLLGLLLQLGTRAAPGARRVRWQLAAVDREHLLADQPRLVAHQQHVTEHRRDLARHVRNERRDRREVRRAIARQCHEHHVLAAGALDRAR